MTSPSLARFACLSITAALLTIALKYGAYLLTGSVGLLSDAIESVVNLLGAMMALAMLIIAARPADEEHPFGHGKAEYFSSGLEGGLIVVAAGAIITASVSRFISPQPLEQVGWGLAVSVVASLVNLAVARILLRAAKAHDSITLEADAHHLLTDVWTSVGVIGAVALVAISGWQRLDPIVGIIVALNIIWTGYRIIKKSIRGLMDASLPPGEQQIIRDILDVYRDQGIEHHALRTIQAGARRVVSFHLLVPSDWTVYKGHRLVDKIEEQIKQSFPGITVVLGHLEALNDPASFNDTEMNDTASNQEDSH